MGTTEAQRHSAAPAFGAALLLLAAHVATKAARDALFLSNFPVTLLPRAMMAAALASLLGAALMSRLLARRAPQAVVPVVLLLSGGMFVAEWRLVRFAPGIGSVAVYLHFAALGAVLLSGFWSVVNERFDPHAGKGIVARIGGFATLGGVLGGLSVGQLAPVLDVGALLLVLAGLHVACAVCVRGIGGPAAGRAHATAAEPGRASGLSLLRRTPFLLRMAGLIALLAVTETLIDYALKVEAKTRFADEESLIRFFAGFYTLIGLGAFLLQTVAGAHVLRRLGLGGAMALLPATIATTGASAALLPGLWTLVLARGGSAILTNSFFRAGFELLYTPIPPETKRPTKAYVDVGAQRLGDLAGGALILALLLLVPGMPARVFLVLAVGTALGALVLVTRLRHAYVRQLAEKLRAGTIALAEGEAVDATTVRALSESRVILDRAELLARIDELHATRYAAEGATAVPETETAGSALEELFGHIRNLASGDAARIRRALAEAPGDSRLVPHVLPLLERFDVLDDVRRYLGALAPRLMGQLADALADPARNVLIRRRLPGVLEAGRGRRAIDGLRLGLDDPDFEVRVQCARSAARLILRDAALGLDAAEAHVVAARELEVDDRIWEQQGRRRAGAADDSVLLEGAMGGWPDRSIEHAFTVLSLAYGMDMMGSALRALHAGDENLQGTALEYLQATLPEAVFKALWRRVPGAMRGDRPRRPAHEVAGELLRTATLRRVPRGPAR
jgi:hypothetical protein